MTNPEDSYPRPIVSVDLAIFGLTGGGLEVLLTRRGAKPFAGKWALPGGWSHVAEDTDLEAAARRVLNEKTGVDTPYLEQLQTVGNSGRDPRGWSLSIAYVALISADDVRPRRGVNTTDSAVRVTHLPTGIVISCQDEKSQHKNRAKALRVLRARLLDIAKHEQQEKISRERRSQIGTGDRSERIRTYNFPQGRVTDHRINLTLYKLGSILDGELDEVLEALQQADQAERLKEFDKSEVRT